MRASLLNLKSLRRLVLLLLLQINYLVNLLLLQEKTQLAEELKVHRELKKALEYIKAEVKDLKE